MKRSKNIKRINRPVTMTPKEASILLSNPAWDRFYIPSTAPIQVQVQAVQLGLTIQ